MGPRRKLKQNKACDKKSDKLKSPSGKKPKIKQIKFEEKSKISCEFCERVYQNTKSDFSRCVLHENQKNVQIDTLKINKCTKDEQSEIQTSPNTKEHKG